MRFWPRSLFGRLLAIAGLSTAAALFFAALTIGHVLERFVMRGFDDRLDAQVAVIARAVRPDGTLDTARVVDLAGFDEQGSGWTWQVDGPAGQHWSSAAEPIAVPRTFARAGEPRHLRHAADFIPGEGRGASGEPLHSRTLAVPTPAGAVVVTAIGPRRIVDAPIREAMLPLLLSLLLLGFGLAVATLLQLRIGLGPLRGLQASLAEVRAGRQRYVPTDQPLEIAPLVAELNALIDQNETGLTHARQHVANLAHGLKTRLASLALKLSESGCDPDGSLGDMVRQIDGRVRHHLGRARLAAPGGGRRVRTLLAPAVTDLITVLLGIHAARAVEPHMAIDPDLAVAVDPQDLDELLGNLLDNAWRHANTSIRIDAALMGTTVIISIEDDGAGLDDAAIAEALLPGRRLDERGDGHGFGLSIARELAELNGGHLQLARSPRSNGLLASVTLPAR